MSEARSCYKVHIFTGLHKNPISTRASSHPEQAAEECTLHKCSLRQGVHNAA